MTDTTQTDTTQTDTDTGLSDPGAAVEEPATDDRGAEDAGGTAGGGDEVTAVDGGGDRGDLHVREGDIAADYLERLLDIVDFDGDIDLDVENDRAAVAIVGTGLDSLVGRQGETLDALQELTRLAVQQQTGVRSRLMLDVSGYREARRESLRVLARQSADNALATHESIRLSPMNPFERKVVHDALAEIDGVRSESEGEEPQRRVVVLLDS